MANHQNQGANFSNIDSIVGKLLILSSKCEAVVQSYLDDPWSNRTNETWTVNTSFDKLHGGDISKKYIKTMHFIFISTER